VRLRTPKALSEFLGRDIETALAKLRLTPNDRARILARPYQVDANTEMEKAIAERKRHMLIAMAAAEVIDSELD
jgi:type I site-specific restriction endonuclease